MKKFLFLILLISVISFSVFSQSPTYNIYALKYASIGHPFPLKYLVLNAPEKDSLNAIFMFWLIKGSNGKNVLVDAGFLNDVEEAKDYDVIHYTRPASMLLELGLKPSCKYQPN